MEIISEQEIIAVTLKVIEKFVVPDFVERGYNASGDWLRSLRAEAEKNKGIIKGLDYTKYLVDGRHANKDQSPEAIENWVGWAGSTFLKQWVDNKGLNLSPYAVAYVIARQGTKIYRDGGSDFLRILETKEVQDFIISELDYGIKTNVINTFRRELNKLEKS